MIAWEYLEGNRAEKKQQILDAIGDGCKFKGCEKSLWRGLMSRMIEEYVAIAMEEKDSDVVIDKNDFLASMFAEIQTYDIKNKKFFKA